MGKRQFKGTRRKEPQPALIGIIVLVVCALIAVNMILLLCAAWIVTYAGLMFLGFGGCRWRSDMAINYYRCPVDVGLLMRGTNTGLLQAFRLRIESSS
jgi:hypothetical protein